MSKPGRKKTPTAILEKRGSWLAKTRKAEPIAPCGHIDPPQWLDGEARRAWDELSPQLSNMGVLRKTDWRLLSRYCVYWVLWMKELSKVVRSEPDLERYANQLCRMERELGLTPSARADLSVDSEEDKKDRFLRVV